MEAEKVLQLIMKKMKEYKANPAKSSLHEKSRQKNLTKMFEIYRSLKKSENTNEIKTDQQEHAETDKLFKENENTDEMKTDQQEYVEINKSNSSNEEVITDKTLETSNEQIKMENPIETIYLMSDDTINYQNGYNSELQKHVYFIKCDEDASKFKTHELESSNAQESKDFENEEQVYGEQSMAVEEFLGKIGERLKKLPYRKRSKLEVEFFKRLIEVQESVDVLGD